IPMFHNNLWRVPTAIRVMASACTQYQMFLQSRPDRLVAFSSYSMSLDLVARVGYWDDDVIPEDSRFYWKAFFTTAGRLKMIPVCLPIYGDAPQSRDWSSTHVNQYNQIKRWACLISRSSPSPCGSGWSHGSTRPGRRAGAGGVSCGRTSSW